MKANQSHLRKKCKQITYLPNGALSMKAEDLQDGAACHSQILENNLKADAKSCLTCVAGSKPVGARYDGKELRARYASTDDTIPDWYVRRGIYSPLPPPFTCDPKFHPPEEHTPSDAPELVLDLNNADDVPKDATIGYWAAKASPRIKEAGDAYDDFSNSGIVKCVDGICRLRVHYPGRYTAEGRVYNPHIHFAVWQGNQWDPVARTVEFHRAKKR